MKHPLGPGGKITASETCEWFQGGFAVVCRSKGTGPRGSATGLNVTAYDTSRNTYTCYMISSLGDSIFVRGHVKGNVWTFEDQMEAEGKRLKVRATVAEESPTASVFKLEVGPRNGDIQLFPKLLISLKR